MDIQLVLRGSKEWLKKQRHEHVVLFWLGAFVFWVITLGLLFYLFTAYLLPLPNLGIEKETATTKIYDRHGELLYEVLQPQTGKNSYVSLKSIPQHFIQATLAAEDVRFYSHPGVNIGAILRAVFFNLREQRIVSGASTIPQQLVRNLLGTERKRGYWDKIREALYAVRLSHLYSKDQILELYLNRIYYGNLSYGSEAAALDYFGKHLYNLDLAQSSLIAGLPQAPSAYNPFLHFDQAKKRQKYVLQQMARYGFITAAEADVAAKEPLHLRRNITEMKAPHFVHYILNELGEKLDSHLTSQGGLSVYTTLDYGLQKMAEDIVSRQIETLRDKHVSNGALLSLDPKTGQILTWVGSADYFNEDIDGAVDMITTLRQPGSSIKPLTYLLALEKGYTPATILADIPTQFETAAGPYAPKNYDLKFHGPVRLRNALASSFNIPAVRTLDFVGLQTFIAFAQKLGITTLNQNPDYYGLALTLGGGDVRLLDMTHAYNVIANYGDSRPLETILKIDDARGKNVYEFQLPEAEYVLGTYGKEHAYQIIDILKDPLARVGGFGEGNVLELSHEAAVKTGTTRNFRDNWTIGFTPNLLTAVWVGNADASSMHDISGVDGAGPIWHDFMESALQFSAKDFFKIPSSLKQLEICALSGKMPTDLCSERAFEWFVYGSEPKEYDDYYRKFHIHKISGKIIQEPCLKNYPQEMLLEKILVVYPSEFQKWSAQNNLQLPPFEPCALSSDYSTDYPNGYSSEYTGDYSKDIPVFSIDSPNPKDEYLIDHALPLKDQKIPLRVSAPFNTAEVKYFIDDKIVGQVKEPPFTYLWLPATGKHSLRAEAKLLDERVISSKELFFEVK